MPVVINGFYIDAAKAESHTFQSEITDHPVERGSNVTDNIVNKPIGVKVDGIVTNTPIGAMVARRQDAGLPADNAYAMLLKLFDDREPVTIQTSLQVWTDMGLEQLEIPRSAAVGDSVQFTATFKKLTIVDNERATVRVAIPGSGGQANLGNKANKDAFDPKAVAEFLDDLTEPLKRYPKGSPQRRLYDSVLKPSMGDAYKGQNPFNHDLK